MVEMKLEAGREEDTLANYFMLDGERYRPNRGEQVMVAIDLGGRKIKEMVTAELRLVSGEDFVAKEYDFILKVASEYHGVPATMNVSIADVIRHGYHVWILEDDKEDLKPGER